MFIVNIQIIRGSAYMKLISWNVNGIRACIGKGFEESFAALDADIFACRKRSVSRDR